MKKNLLKTHKIYILTLILCFILVLGSFSNVLGMNDYEETEFKTGIVRARSLNVRKGPGLNFTKIASLKKDEYIRIFAKIGDWYVIQTDQNIIGAASAKYIEGIPSPGVETNATTETSAPLAEPNSNSQESVTSESSNSNENTETTENADTAKNHVTSENDVTSESNVTSENATSFENSSDQQNTTESVNQEISEQTSNTNLSLDEEKLLSLINEERSKQGLSALEVDDELQNVARTKAEDMNKNQYFSHTSPEYGSPFDMLKYFHLSYKTAGENIAGNRDVEGAFEAWILSEEHKKNILSNAYNYTGIGIAESAEYGKILVQLFIGK